jgi:hypothetical protein
VSELGDTSASSADRELPDVGRARRDRPAGGGEPLASVRAAPTLAALDSSYPPSTDIILGKILAKIGPRVSPANAPRAAGLGPAAGDPGQDRDDRDHRGGIRPAPQSDPRQGRSRDARHRARAATAGPPFNTLALVNQIAKEALARTAAVTSVAQIGGSLKLF